MSQRTPSEVAQVTAASTTYTGEVRLYWITVSASADSVVTISDDTTELLRVNILAKTTAHMVFMPSIVCKTSLVVAEASGTAFITTCRSGGY